MATLFFLENSFAIIDRRDFIIRCTEYNNWKVLISQQLMRSRK